MRIRLALALALAASPAAAQFNGINGIYALNHMTFGAVPPFTIISGGTNYALNDTLTLSCSSIQAAFRSRPIATVTGVSGGAITAVTLADPGVATAIPSTGESGGLNGVCTFDQFSTSGTGSGATLFGAFGFLTAGLSGLVTASMLASGAAAANIAGGPIAPSSLNVLPGPINMGSYTTPLSAPPTNSLIVTNPQTYGIFGQAVGCSVVTNSTHGPQVLGISATNGLATYSSRDSVGCYVDNTAPAAIANVAGTFTSTTFIPTVALSAGIVAKLKVGMIIDTSDATKYSGFITDWASDGTSITVSAWYQMGNQAAGQVPAGPNAILNPITKIWAHNANVIFSSSSYATAAAGFELGIINNKGYDSGTDTPVTWGYDAVNLGTYTASVGHIARGDFNYGFESTSGRLAGYYYFPGSTQVGPGFLVGKTISGATGFETDQTSGMGFLANGTSGGSFVANSASLGQYLVAGTGGAPLIQLGSPIAASAPTIQLFANGSSNADVSIAAVSGGGAQYAGKLAVFASALYVAPGNGSNNLLISGGAGGSNNTTISTSGVDTDISISLQQKGAGSVNIGTGTANYLAVTGAGTGSNIKDVAIGTDSTINRVISGKSTGLLCLGALSNCGNDALRVAPIASQVNGIQVKGSVAGSTPDIAAFGADTNIDISLTPRGTGTVRIPSLTATGVINASNASAGIIGEYISSTVLIGSAISLTINTPVNVTSVSLTAGDWDCSGNIWFTANASTASYNQSGWISVTSATIPTTPSPATPLFTIALSTPQTGTAAGLGNLITGTARINISSTTTVYLGAQASFTTSTEAAYGFIGCRRVR